VSPLWEYYVDISTSESSLEYICPVSPPRENYVVISSESSGSTDFGPRWNIHVCPVSPPREYYVDISSESSGSTDFG
jgi:hypothetical protein